MINFKWQCPYCNHYTTIVDENFHSDDTYLDIRNKDGLRKLTSQFIVCPNKECNKFTLSLFMHGMQIVSGSRIEGSLLKHWSLIPSSEAKVFPEYIPQVIIDDYTESCAIRDLSPKASATLARRCLQGMIRDFWNVSKSRLVEEIDAIEGKVDPLTWKSIDAVRKIGNIGAHMEKDIDLIVDVEPNEAQLLIQLIELLITEWYINRYEREQRLQEIIQVSDNKQEQRKPKNEIQV